MKVLLSTAMGALALLLVSGAGAEARRLYPVAPPSYDDYDDDVPEGYLPGLSAATGRLCVKQCPADDMPCDPPAFKIADGRCTTQWR